MQIGPYRLRNSMALAPMAGLSDVPFRTLVWRLGAGYMVSEMLSSKPELWESGKSRLRRVPVPGVDPVAVQIAGTDPRVMAEAARRHVDDGVQIIDLNFGCPAKKVCRKAAGSALLSNLSLVADIVGAVVAAVKVPVTVKTRAGLLPGDDVGVQAGWVAASQGAQMVVMHGRSRACKFKGRVDYGPVGRLKTRLTESGIDIPVLVNGDIDSVNQAHNALRMTGADGVMIGGAALGQPWLFAELTGGVVPATGQKFELILQHVAHMHEFYGDQAAVGIVRKHVIAYLSRLGLQDHVRGFLSLHKSLEQLGYLQALFSAENAQPAEYSTASAVNVAA